MKTYMTADFRRRARRAKISDKELRKASREIQEGRADAKIGAGLVKQRVSEGQGGRANSHRAIVATKEGEQIVFIHLFAKNDQGNLTPKELKEFKKAAKFLVAVSESEAKELVLAKEWIEVENPPEEKGVPE